MRSKAASLLQNHLTIIINLQLVPLLLELCLYCQSSCYVEPCHIFLAIWSICPDSIPLDPPHLSLVCSYFSIIHREKVIGHMVFESLILRIFRDVDYRLIIDSSMLIYVYRYFPSLFQRLVKQCVAEKREKLFVYMLKIGLDESRRVCVDPSSSVNKKERKDWLSHSPGQKSEVK